LSSWTIRSTLKWAHETLRGEGVNEARLAAETLLSYALEIDRFKLYLQPDLALNDTQLNGFRSLIAQRLKGIPIQHLVGHVSFMDVHLQVDASVLIPRFETEELVEHALQRCSKVDPFRFLDAGTGSGAIAIALAKALPQVQGVALDCSPEALKVAQSNARLNGVETRLSFVKSDWLSAVEGRFELIVANPPYIPSAQIETLASEVRDHDPRLALDGGEDGLSAIQTLATQAKGHLCPQGWLLLEIGQGQADVIYRLLNDVGYRNISVYADLSGIERIVEAQWES